MRYVLRDGKLVPKHEAAPLSVNASAYVISDGMDPLAHPSTGVLMDSKSAFRKVTRAHGCIEIGDQAPTTPRAPVRSTSADIRESIRTAIQQLEQGHRPNSGTSYEGLGLPT